jgi:hypothetical protein
MSDLSEVAAKLGVPDRLLERSAAARAAAEGIPVEEVLDTWLAGGVVVAEGTPPPAPVEPEAPPEEAAEEVPEEEEAEPVPVPAAPEPEPVPVAAAVPVEREVLPEEERDLVTVVRTVALRERREVSIPRWLLVAFLVVPLYALFYVVVYAGGLDCGAAGLLEVDEQTGGLLNCDGSPFTAGGVAGQGDFVAMGRTLFTSSPAVCARCHGRGGEGTTQGPQLSGGSVLQTFSSCEDHMQWVSLGTTNWPQVTGASTYGDQDKPVGGFGNMPSFGIEVGGPLSEEEIAAVALFERVQFGGQPLEEALTDCGLGPEEEEAADGEESTTTSSAPAGG